MLPSEPDQATQPPPSEPGQANGRLRSEEPGRATQPSPGEPGQTSRRPPTEPGQATQRPPSTSRPASQRSPRGELSEPFVIALDGPAASGKSSVGLGAARRLGLGYFDTGLLYRVLTWLALSEGVESTNGDALARLVDDMRIQVDATGRVSRDGSDITTQLHQPNVDAAVSAVSAHGAVREAMLAAQRALIQPPGLVMAGRDIGTVIVPEAPLKIWLNAGVEERARRRANQTGADYDKVLAGMRGRDRHDASRSVAPMAPAADAVEIDTEGLSPEVVIERIVTLALERGAGAHSTQPTQPTQSTQPTQAAHVANAAQATDGAGTT
jgi:cytidylate kinase